MSTGVIGSRLLARRPARAGLTVAALLALAALPLVLPDATDFLVLVGILYLVVMGLDVLTGYAGQVSLGQTAFMAVGGYGGALLSMRLGWPTALSLLAAAAASALLALVLGLTLLRLRGYFLALATLGLAVIAQGLATSLVGLTGGPSGLVGVPNLGLGPLVLTDPTSYYELVLVLCLAGALFKHNLVRSQSGRALVAVAADQQAAAVLGIDPGAFKTGALVLSAVYASVAVSVYADYFRFFSPDLIAVTVAFSLIVMLALGGSRSLLGPLLGVILLQLLPRAGQAVALYEPLIAGIVLVLVVTYFPAGLWGGARRAWEALAREQG